MMLLLQSITHSSYLGEETSDDHTECKLYTKWEVFKYNYLVWCIGFILFGCQFTHADVGPMQHFTLSWDSMKSWGVFLWAIFIGIILFVVFLLYSLATAYLAVNILEYYVVWILLLTAFIIWNTKRYAGQKHFHLHHYALAMILQSVICYQSLMFTLLQGFFAGMMVEGGCRWGFDPVWIDNEVLPESIVAMLK